MKLSWSAIALACSLALTGCYSHSAPADGPEPPVDAISSPVLPDAQSCKAQGGALDRRGRAQTLMCVHPYPDAGKACRDNQQCTGKCVTAPDDGPDGQIVGTCQADDALFGCYAEVVDGKAVRAICVD
ncbi:hypothetical protein [Croceicoccus sp. Ery15]|uniref:hypothetical protein n=1 Tax=Croceicoccus sp. Ery15 TaxID=1703338 RepID=UPI001E4BE924|nr:hypothetical protein [Croceicoccus sp. Ery15]